MKTGLGLRPPFYNEVLETRPAIGFFEIISENFMNTGGRPRKVLESVRKNYPLAFHGVSLSIGSIDPLRMDYLKKLKSLVDDFEPFVVSDHLSWSQHQGENTFDLLPIQYTFKNLRHIAERVEKVQNFLRRKIYLENPSLYVLAKANELPESEFLRELCRLSGCGIMLDLNNLVVNRHNVGVDYDVYMQDIANVDVPQFHLAGHSLNKSLRIDTHDHAPDAETVALFKRAHKIWPAALPLLEWDDLIPPFAELKMICAEIDLMMPAQFDKKNVQLYENTFGELVTEGHVTNELVTREHVNAHLREHAKVAENEFWVSKNYEIQTPQYFDQFLNFLKTENQQGLEPVYSTAAAPTTEGLHVYSSAYFTRIVSVLKNNYPALAYVCSELFEDVIRAYLSAYPPRTVTVDGVGDSLSDFLRTHKLPDDLGAPAELLSNLAALEKTKTEVFLAPNEKPLSVHELTSLTGEDWLTRRVRLISSTRVLHLEYAVHETVNAVNKGLSPAPPDAQPHFRLVYRKDLELLMKELDLNEGRLFTQLQESTLLTECIEVLKIEPQDLVQFLIAQSQHLVIDDNDSSSNLQKVE